MTKQKSRTRRTLHYFLLILIKRKLVLTLSLVSVVLAIFFGETLIGYYFGRLFSELVKFQSGDPTDSIYNLAWFIITVYVLQIIFWRIHDYTFSWRQAHELRDLEQYIFSRLPNYSYKFYSETYSGALVSQVNRFIKAYQEFGAILAFDYLVMISRICLATGFLLFLAQPIGILLGAWSVVFVVAVAFLSIKKSPITRVEAAADSRVTAALSDAITNMINIKIFARTNYEKKRFNAVSYDRFKKRSRSWRLNSYIREFRWQLILWFFVAYMLISINLVINGSVTASTVFASQIYILAILASLLQLHQVIQRTEQLFADSAELTDVLDKLPELTDPDKPEPVKIDKGKIEFDSVRFRYQDGSRNVFADLNLKIPAGQKVGLVGHSGSGKSSLSRLLLRFVDVQKGQILIDSQDISKITQDDLRSNIAYVPQEPILFHRSLAENIAYGREEATEQEVINASKLAHAAEFVEKMPEGYETLVGERGVKLSGGEKQRVAIARAMLSKAPILILDEATSALDSKSENLIAKALDELMKKRTTIVIAHRLSTIKKMDRIIVLKDGAIVEDGTHESLLKKKGEYAELWHHQSGGFLEE